jgi:AcrR family transcriptional regulator
MMGVIEKRAKHKEEFRREILDSARELFVNDGYDKFSMRKLAEKIGYSPTTIYLCFKGKEDLLLAISEEFFGNFWAELNRIRSVSQDPVEALRKSFLYFMEFGLKNPNQYKVIFFTKSACGRSICENEEFRQRDSMKQNVLFAFKDMVLDCIKAKRFRELDEDVIMTSLAVASHGLVTMTLSNPDIVNEKLDIVARTMVDALFRGYER